MNKLLRPIAIYLPQFHPIPENDAWWGKGFTEWTNVTKARPLFKGHYQPHLPADLGFYDLRLPEVREAQAELARQYGIYGFCYYHYWFNGKRVLERPLTEVLNTGKPDFPFCLCWANENWTRRWDGKDNEVLLRQEYSEADDKAHMAYLCKIFEDRRYIRINGKPVFSVYRTELFPDIKRTAEIWREEAYKQGIGEIYLARIESFKASVNPIEIGFDAAIEFQPDWRNLPARINAGWQQRLAYRIEKKRNPFNWNQVYSFKDFIQKMLAKPAVDYKLYPSVIPSWDNSARRQNGALILHESTPALYEDWLSRVVRRFTPYSAEENFIFINAWNEWAEGNHLEPCQKWGKAYLEATLRVIQNA